MVLVDDLKELDIFSDLPINLLEEIKNISSYKNFKKDTVFKGEGEASNDFYIIKEGKVAFETNIYLEKTVRLSIATKQEYFGESALIPPYKAFTTRKAIEDSKMIVIEGKALRTLLEKYPKLGYHIMTKVTEMLSKRLHKTRSSLINCHFS